MVCMVGGHTVPSTATPPMGATRSSTTMRFPAAAQAFMIAAQQCRYSKKRVPASRMSNTTVSTRDSISGVGAMRSRLKMLSTSMPVTLST